MERWKNRVALVIGANSGIGRAIAKLFAQNGLKVIGADTMMDNMELVATEVKEDSGSFIPYQCDLRKDSQVEELFNYLEREHGGIHVCVNCAAILSTKPILNGSPDEWRNVLDVNVVGLCHSSKLAANLMMKKNVDDGHIINLASLHCYCYIPATEQHFYRMTKYAVKAVTEGIRYELIEAKSNIRVTVVCPGSTNTDIIRNSGFSAEYAKKYFSPELCIEPEDIANSVLHVLSLPETVQVQEIHVARSGREF